MISLQCEFPIDQYLVELGYGEDSCKSLMIWLTVCMHSNCQCFERMQYDLIGPARNLCHTKPLHYSLPALHCLELWIVVLQEQIRGEDMFEVGECLVVQCWKNEFLVGFASRCCSQWGASGICYSTLKTFPHSQWIQILEYDEARVKGSANDQLRCLRQRKHCQDIWMCNSAASCWNARRTAFTGELPLQQWRPRWYVFMESNSRQLSSSTSTRSSVCPILCGLELLQGLLKVVLCASMPTWKWRWYPRQRKL